MKKIETLQKILAEMEKAVCAYSGGVDSTFLLKIAREVLQDNILAVTVANPLHPVSHTREASRLAKEMGVGHILIKFDKIEPPILLSNPKNRCYYCKEYVFSKIAEAAHERVIEYIIDGSNTDDLKDYRPGLKALEELGVRSPLAEAGLTKKEIRNLSKEMGLETWDKPSYACLATRIPFGEVITADKLERIEKAEEFLLKLGLSNVRVRDYDTLVRIETLPDEFDVVTGKKTREKIVDKLKKLGYTYITLDLEGYRSGSLNEVIDK